ncbi:MAG: cysteine--tRNA ligase [Gemmatimonadales bacterium]|nr:cysteine--tRNA ligase [Gemmatimonadales bacterium]
MSLRLHNTLTRDVRPFVPLVPGRVTLYTCGPTIYNVAHIGNFRTFLFEDLLRRWLEASGYEVFHVMNLTDVDDKTIRGAAGPGAPPAAPGDTRTPLRRFTDQYAERFFEDGAYLRLRPATVHPRATEYIPQQVALVESLLAKGHAYVADDGSVYFSIASFPPYGRLARLDLDALRAGASGRTSADEYDKEHAHDFVLWKAARPEDEAVGAAWDAPFGRGRPGWHLECSAMALDLLRQHGHGEVLDIHAGGVDLVFPHHEDEIAQSCAHTGQPLFARWWMHGEFLQLRGTKMSKRYGNILTARDLREQGVDAAAVRLLVFSTHYRSPLDWTDEALAAAREGAKRLGRFRDRWARLPATGEDDGAFASAAAKAWAGFAAALDDDLNAPQALAALFGFVSEGNALLDQGRAPGPSAREAWARMDAVLDVLPAPEAVAAEAPAPADLTEAVPADAGAAAAWALGWAGRRREAKARRDFAEADRIRQLVQGAGFAIRDGKDGSFEVVRA